MTLEIRLNNQDIAGLLTGPPRIVDQTDAVCRTLDLPVNAAENLVNFIGQPVELWYRGKRWFYGRLWRRGFESNGQVSYFVYDPMIYFKKNIGSFYFKQQTATQGIEILAEYAGVKIGTLANTAIRLGVKPPLHYPGKPPDKVAIDLLARTYQAGGKKFWYRFDPDAAHFGLQLFERITPAMVWAFQRGINLTAAKYEETLDETYNVVKLVNRETGKIVTKKDAKSLADYGQLIHWQEVDKNQAATMDALAAKILAEKSKVKVGMSIEGVNPEGIMPMFFAGDVIYVEEDYTQIMGAYYIRNITQTILSDKLVSISAEIQEAPDVPAIQYTDADQEPNAKTTASKSKDRVSVKGGKGTGYNSTAAVETRKKVKELGLTITSADRSKSHNTKIGGSPTSKHLKSRAYDVAGPKAKMDAFAAWARKSGLFTEVLWQVKGHYDHVHVGW